MVTPIPASVFRTLRRLLIALMAAGLGLTLSLTATTRADAATLSVRQIQWNLAALGYLNYTQIDGINGTNTKAAVSAFQGNRCLQRDGVVGTNTSSALLTVVRSVQAKAGTTQDGLAGSNTKTAITNYQRAHGLSPVDGMAGPATFKAMGLTRQLNCGGGPLIIGDPLTDSSSVACGAGTTNLGVWNAYHNGRRYSARLCAIPGFISTSEESTPGTRFYIPGANHNVIVNSRVSRAVLAMFKAAKAQGLTLRANSSFRTYAHQQALCPCDGVNVARPGYSLHQSAVAIDFSGPTTKGGSTCSTRATSTSATWKWLVGHAHAYGYYQYAHESWHWDTLRGSSRC